MAVKIKLMRMGKMRAPYYRVVVADARTRRDGRAIETIGKYHPKDDPSYIEINSERAQYWLGVGAQPTEPVAAILRVTGDWQRFRGEPAPAPMKLPAAKPDRRAAFETAAREGLAGGDAGAATTPRKRAKKPDGAEATQAEATLAGATQAGAAGAAPSAAAPTGPAPAGTAPAESTPADAGSTDAASVEAARASET